MRRLLLIGILGITSCTAQRTKAPPDGGGSAEPRVLTMTAASADHVAGSYAFQGSMIGFDFTNRVDVQHFAITDANGRELLTQFQIGDMLLTSVFAGRATTIVNLAIIRESARQATLPEAERVPFDAGLAVVMLGDQSEFPRFDTTPEGALVPWLSRDLGERGFNGRAYPMTVRLHLIASNIATELNLDIPQPGGPIARTTPDGGGICEDLRDDPHGNNCYGLCGPGCTCWASTCGDCCCHDGCKSHDWTCRNCHWYTPWNCTLCGLFLSFTWGACGDSCQETTFAPPCTIGPYEQCNGRCVCTGTYDGSTEEGAAPVQWGCQQLEQGCDPNTGTCDPNLYCMPMPY